jgi:PAS domain S-box-containing protein
VNHISDTPTERRQGERRTQLRRLTDRQTAILELVATGLENKEIAHQLGISEQAVKEHVSNLLRVLSAPNRAALGDAAATRRFVGTADIEPEWLHVLFLDAPVFVALLEGLEHRFLAANEAYRRAAGPRTLIGRTFREAFPDLDETGIVRLLDEAYATGESRRAMGQPARWYRERPDEPTPGYLTLLIQPMRRTDGTVGGVVFFGIDATDQVNATNAASQLADEREAILAQLPSGVIVVDRNGSILTINEAGQRILPFEPDGITKPWEVLELRDLGTGRELRREDRPLLRALAGEQSPETDYLGVNVLTGDRFSLRISASPLFASSGEVRGAIAVFTDIARPSS